MKANIVVNYLDRILVTAAVILSTSASFAQTTPAQVPACPSASTRCDFLEDPQPLALPTKAVGSLINLNDGSIEPELVTPLLTNLFQNNGTYAARALPGLMKKGTPTLDSDYLRTKAAVIVHVVVWNQNAADPTAATPDQRWYVYENGRLRTDLRLFGKRRFWLVYIHLNRGAATYTVRYDFQSTQATPQNLQNLGLLASIVFAKPPSGQEKSLKPGTNNDVWGAKELNFPFPTSDIKISPSIKAKGGSVAILPSGSPAEPAPAAVPKDATPPSDPAAKDGVLGAPQTFHNEATEWWDVSVGFPVTNVNQLSFNQSSTAGAFTPSKVDNKKLLGLLDLYLIPKQRYQIAESGFSWIPSIVLGLPMAGQPLHKPVAALGWGPPLIQFYAGAVVYDQPTLPAGSISTKNVCTGWCPQFTFGINFGVKAITNKLNAKSAQ